MRGYWTAAQTRTHEEQRAAHHVERQGFRYYLPQTIVLTERGVERRELLFPGYIFIFVRPRGDWRVLSHTRGIRRLFLCDERPTRVPTEEINRLCRMEDERGLVRLWRDVPAGARVRVSAGTFAGVRGLSRGMCARERVRVLTTLLGRQVEIDVDVRQVELAA